MHDSNDVVDFPLRVYKLQCKESRTVSGGWRCADRSSPSPSPPPPPSIPPPEADTLTHLTHGEIHNLYTLHN